MDSVSKDYDVTVDMSRHAPGCSEMPAWKIDGAIILAKCSPATMKEIIQLNTPYVMVNGVCPEGGFSVVPDDIGGTRLAIEHLTQLGHKKIAYCGPLPPETVSPNIPISLKKKAEYQDLGLEVDVLTTHSSLKDRYQTYLNEMQKYGLEPVAGSGESFDAATDFLGYLMTEKGVTAILAYGHMGALNLMQAAHTLEIPVPERLSLMCFCDKYAHRVMSPGLTFIDLCSEKMGKVTAELLLDQIQNPTQVKPSTITLRENLVVCNSTAPPYGAS
jgi:DNA-binding LacI/PurR family transcriptional regulator